MPFVMLFDSLTAVNGKPTLATHGVPFRLTDVENGFPVGTLQALLLLWSDDGATGTVAATVRLWGYCSDRRLPDNTVITIDDWFPLGIGADGTKGTMNAGAAAGETDTDKVTHSEVLANFMGFDRIYGQLLSPSGGGAAFNLAMQAGV